MGWRHNVIDMRRVFVLILLAVAPVALAKSRVVRSVQFAWHAPQCEQTGLPWLRYIDAAGNLHKSAVDSTSKPRMTTEALAIGVMPNEMWAVTYDGAIHRSLDAGCTWGVHATVPEVLARKFEPEILARNAERLYVTTKTHIVRITGATVETFALPVTPDGEYVVTEVSRTNSLHLRAATRWGHVHESLDGARTWSRVTQFVLPSEIKSAAFHPHDFDHLLVGTRHHALFVSHNGGRTFGAVPAPLPEAVNEIHFSPADPQVVWLDANAHAIGLGGKLYRSNDGGRTFVHISTNPNALYFMDGVFAPARHDPDTIAFRDNPGVQVVSGMTHRAWRYELVKKVVWTPAGTLYYLVQLVEPR